MFTTRCEPVHKEDLPKIMHWLNWYTAMCFNRMLNRTGHFWEKRYYSTGFDKKDHRRALNTLRYIHTNPKAAVVRVAECSMIWRNYGRNDRLTDDGLTQWHQSFKALGQSLEECARKYRGFCRRKKPQPKVEKRCHWGSKLLPKVIKPPGKKSSPGQMSLPWGLSWDAIDPEILAVAKQFVLANCYNPTSSLRDV